jgi:hypothetical protein
MVNKKRCTIAISVLLVLAIILPLAYAAKYGSGAYGCGLYGIGCDGGGGGGGAGGGGGGGASSTMILPKVEEHIPKVFYECYFDSDCKKGQYCLEHNCYDAECLDDSVCDVKAGETCLNHRCVKLFDMEILQFESPVKVGEFFDFTFLLKAVAEINGDVEIRFWIEQNRNIITSGHDTIYFGSFEEKIKTKKLFLPEDISSGTYIFNIEVIYGKYTASAHRVIGIEVKDGLATIEMKSDFSPYMIYGLTALAIVLLFFIIYLIRKNIKSKPKRKSKKKKGKKRRK